MLRRRAPTFAPPEPLHGEDELRSGEAQRVDTPVGLDKAPPVAELPKFDSFHLLEHEPPAAASVASRRSQVRVRQQPVGGDLPLRLNYKRWLCLRRIVEALEQQATLAPARPGEFELLDRPTARVCVGSAARHAPETVERVLDIHSTASSSRVSTMSESKCSSASAREAWRWCS